MLEPAAQVPRFMAIYHLSVKAFGRSRGQSATAAAAYRSAARIRDVRTGEIHDFSRKGGVVHRELVLPENPPAWASDRERLWNAAEGAEHRKNSTVAREFEIALPSELGGTGTRRPGGGVRARHCPAASLCRGRVRPPSRPGWG